MKKAWQTLQPIETAVSDFSATAHALATAEAKGFSLDAVRAVWDSPDVTYPSSRYRGQHKRIGGGLCLCCEDADGKVVTLFVDQTNTPIRADQRDADSQAWAKKNGMT